MLKKILILQNKIPHYRKAVYNRLSEFYDVTVLHSGDKSVNEKDKYKEKIVENKKIWKFNIQKNIIQEITDNKYDAIIAMFDIAWINNIVALYARDKKTKFIWWGHRYSKKYIVNIIRNYLMKNADAHLLYSDKEINDMVKSGIRRESIFVANNTIEVKNHGFCKECKKKSFLFVGRAQKRKRVDLLLKAFATIKDELSNYITIDIVGEGAENKILKQLARELNIEERVCFHGAITEEEELKPLFEKAFAYISPGPVGLGVLHSLAYGVPVVTHKYEYHGPEFDNLTSKNSIVYENHNELPNILLEFAKNNELSYRLGKNAYEHYKNFRTIDNMIKGFLDAINYVCEEDR